MLSLAWPGVCHWMIAVKVKARSQPGWSFWFQDRALSTCDVLEHQAGLCCLACSFPRCGTCTQGWTHKNRALDSEVASDWYFLLPFFRACLFMQIVRDTSFDVMKPERSVALQFADIVLSFSNSVLTIGHCSAWFIHVKAGSLISGAQAAFQSVKQSFKHD